MTSFAEDITDLPDLLTTKEVASLFRVNYACVLAWDHHLRPVRTPTGGRLYPKKHIVEYVDSSFSPKKTREADRV